MTYYTATGNPVQQTRGTSPAIRNEFALIQTAFGMLPSATALAGGSANYAADNGIANAYAVTISAQITAYYDGLEVVFKAGNANTGVSTINVNTLGLITITRPDGAALQANDIFAGQIVTIAYSGTTNTFQLSYSCLAAANAAASSASSAASSASSASGSASAAASSATAAASSAASASGSASSASSASTSATTASTSATNAASSATSASTSASTATTQASNASSSATSAATSASNAATSATNAATSASNAANSAANAAASATLAGQVFSGTSSTSLTIGTGTQTFTTQPSLAFVVSNPVTIANSGSHYMTGVVSSYNSSTGAMTVSVNATVGSGTYTTWSIGVTPPLVGATLTNPVLINPALGTPSSGVATNLTGTAAGLSIGGNAATATSLTGTLSIANGGTGSTGGPSIYQNISRSAFLRETNGGTLVIGGNYSIYTGGGAITMYLPAGVNGDVIYITNLEYTWATNNFTITSANSNVYINQVANTSLVCDVNSGGFTLFCSLSDGTNSFWIVK